MMNISPYIIALIGLGLLTQGEFILSGLLVSLALLEITLPNLNLIDSSNATFFRYLVATVAVVLLVYRFTVR